MVGRCIGAAVHQRLSAHNGNSVLLQQSAYKWIGTLKNGRTNVTYDKGAGKPSMVITEDNIENAHDMVLLDRRVTIDEVVHVQERWVPKHLTELHKQTCVDICQKHLGRYGNETDIFLDRIITGDETWVHHYKLESKRPSMEWKHPQSPCKKKFKSQISAGTLSEEGHKNKQCTVQ